MDFLSGSSTTIQGLPGSSVPTATGSDTISIKPTNLTHVDGVLHIPIGWPGSPEWWALFDVFGKAGVGWVHSDVTYNCVGFCRFTPTVPAFSGTQSTTQAGLFWGIGFGTPLPVKGFRGPPPILSFEFDQVATGSKNIFLGTPATRQVGASVGPEHINMFRASITQAIDFGAVPWGGWGQGLVAVGVFPTSWIKFLSRHARPCAEKDVDRPADGRAARVTHAGPFSSRPRSFSASGAVISPVLAPS